MPPRYKIKMAIPLMLTCFFLLSVLSVAETAQGWEVIITRPDEGEIISGIYNITGEVHKDPENDTVGEVARVNVSFNGGTEYVTRSSGPEYSNWYILYDTKTLANGEVQIKAILYLYEEDHGNDTSRREWQEAYDTVNVQVQNEPPEAIIDDVSPREVMEGDSVHFMGHGVPADGKTIVDYQWWFILKTPYGDKGIIMSNSPEFNYSGLVPGNHTIYFKVKDDLGLWSDTVETSVIVRPLEEWPQYQQGFTRSGSGTTQANGTTIMWNYTTGSEEDLFKASPIVAHGRVFVTLCGWDLRGRYGTIYAFDANGTYNGVQGSQNKTSDLLWKFRTPDQIVASPAYRDGIVYVATNHTHGYPNVFAIDALTGEEVWNYTIKDDVISAPAVMGDLLLLTSIDWKVYALNPATGDLIWTKNVGSPVKASPAYALGRVFLLTVKGHLYILDASDGHVIMHRDFGGSHETAPIFYKGRIFFAARGEAGSDDRIYARSIFDLSDDAEGAWYFTSDGRILATPVISDGVIYFGTDKGTLYALGTDRTLIWTIKLGAKILGLSASDGMIYVSRSDGNITAVSSNGSVVWSVDTGSPVKSPAVPIYGHLYFGSGNLFTCLWGGSTPPQAIILEIQITDPDFRFKFKNYDPLTVSEGVGLTLKGSGTTPDGSEITKYEWTSSLEGLLGNQAVVEIEGLKPGDHDITLYVWDEHGLKSLPSVTRVVVFSNERPVPRFEVSHTYVNEFTVFDVSSSYDPDGNISRYRIDFGDGSEALEWSDETEIYHKYTHKGTYLVRLYVWDEWGLKSETEMSSEITVTERPVIGRREEGGEGGVPITAIAISILIILAIFLLLIFFTRYRGPPKKKRLIEFEEAPAEEEPEEEKERLIEEIAAQISKERVIQRKRVKRPPDVEYAKKGRPPRVKKVKKEKEEDGEEKEEERDQHDEKEGEIRSLDDLASELERLRKSL